MEPDGTGHLFSLSTNFVGISRHLELEATLGDAGPSHHALEDLGLMRLLPNMSVIIPADGREARLATGFIANRPGPFYVRLSREALEPILPNGDFKFGTAQIIRSGKDVTICACGIMVKRAFKAALKLAELNIDAAVLNCSTLKPFDKQTLLNSAKTTGAVVTAEEHSILGGLGDVVSHVLSSHLPVPVERVGIPDTFCESAPTEQQLQLYGLTSKDIVEAACRAIRRKSR